MKLKFRIECENQMRRVVVEKDGVVVYDATRSPWEYDTKEHREEIRRAVGVFEIGCLPWVWEDTEWECEATPYDCVHVYLAVHRMGQPDNLAKSMLGDWTFSNASLLEDKIVNYGMSLEDAKETLKSLKERLYDERFYC